MNKMTLEQLKQLEYRIEMPDGYTWSVPVDTIAKNRAENYKDEFGDDLQRSLDEDTWKLFLECRSEIKEWARNNMNWSDVKDVAKRLQHLPVPLVDYEDGWMFGSAGLCEKEDGPA